MKPAERDELIAEIKATWCCACRFNRGPNPRRGLSQKCKLCHMEWPSDWEEV